MPPQEQGNPAAPLCMGPYNAETSVMTGGLQFICLGSLSYPHMQQKLFVALTPAVQALWTQAREKLKVLTIICANNTYAILQVCACHWP